MLNEICLNILREVSLVLLLHLVTKLSVFQVEYCVNFQFGLMYWVCVTWLDSDESKLHNVYLVYFFKSITCVALRVKLFELLSVIYFAQKQIDASCLFYYFILVNNYYSFFYFQFWIDSEKCERVIFLCFSKWHFCFITYITMYLNLNQSITFRSSNIFV